MNQLIVQMKELLRTKQYFELFVCLLNSLTFQPVRWFFFIFLAITPAFQYSPIHDLKFKLLIIDVVKNFVWLFLAVYTLKLIVEMSESVVKRNNAVPINCSHECDLKNQVWAETLPVLYMLVAIYYIGRASIAIPEVSKNSPFIFRPLLSLLPIKDNNDWHSAVLDYAQIAVTWLPVWVAVLLALFLTHGARALYVIHKLDHMESKSDFKVKAFDWAFRIVIGILFIIFEQALEKLHHVGVQSSIELHHVLSLVAITGIILYFALAIWGFFNIKCNAYHLPWFPQLPIAIGGTIISIMFYFIVSANQDPLVVLKLAFTSVALFVSGIALAGVLVFDFLFPQK
jgi:hypothetical protein